MLLYSEYLEAEHTIWSFKHYAIYALVRRGNRFYRIVANPFPFVYRAVEYKPWRF